MGIKGARLELPHGPGTKVTWVVRIATPDDPEPLPILAESMLDVERTIDAHTTKCAGNVVRVVHTLNSREFHRQDGTTTVITWEPLACDWRCADCGIDTDAIDEYYMVHDQIWKQVANDVPGHLCIGCLERRLDRTLTPADFTDRSINNIGLHAQRSPRLKARIKPAP